jgi:hypothetical protein
VSEENLLVTGINTALAKRASFNVLADRSLPSLFDTLGTQVGEAARGSLTSANYEAHVDPDLITRGNAMEEVGKRVFQRWSSVVFQIVCKPDAEDKDLQVKLLQALTGKETGTAALAGILVASFGLSPAVAAVLAALFVKIVAQPAVGGLCDVWNERIKASLLVTEAKG